MGCFYDCVVGKVDELYWYDYYMVLLIEYVIGQYLVDYQVYFFQEWEVYFVSLGQVYQVLVEVWLEGWVFIFFRDFLVENNIFESFIFNINFFKVFGDMFLL